MEISKPLQYHPTMPELMRLYERCYNKSHGEVDGTGFLRFWNIWRISHVYKISCGWLRFEPYPEHGGATIHGIFTGNPFKCSEEIKSMLELYLEKHPEFNGLQCHVKKERRGLKHLIAPIAHKLTYQDGNLIFHYGRKK